MLYYVVGYWAYIRGTNIRGGLTFGEGEAYIWNEVSVRTCGGLIHGGGYILGGGLYSEVYGIIYIHKS